MNLWRKFLGLLPSDPTVVATVSVSYGNSKYLVTVQGGTSQIAYSDAAYTAGARVFVQGDRIQRVAPSLSLTVIDV